MSEIYNFIVEYLTNCLCDETAIALREAIYLLYNGLGDIERYKYPIFNALGIENPKGKSGNACSLYRTACCIAPWNGSALKSISLLQR